jgi:hypothetical protein
LSLPGEGEASTSSSALEQQEKGMKVNVTETTEQNSEDSRFEAISLTFEGKTKYLIPKQHFCIVLLTLKQLKKLMKWKEKDHDIGVSVQNNGELMLINETLHGKWFERKQKQKKGPA